MDICVVSSNIFSSNFSFTLVVNDQIGKSRLAASGETESDIINTYVVL